MVSPVIRTWQAVRNDIAAFVRKRLDAQAADQDADVSLREVEIDARVEFLYFHQHEAATYDAWLKQGGSGSAERCK